MHDISKDIYFRSISDFMSTTHEQNKMFLSCQRYVKCPYMRELCFAVSLMYYHFLRPFLVACGAEAVEGYKQLTHSDLCLYYPALIEELKSVSAGGVEKILKPETLAYLEPWKALSEVSHKGHRAIFDSLFSELTQVSPDLSQTVIKKVVSVIAEGWAGVFRSQIGRFYLDGGSVKELLKNDPHCFDGVPTNALSSEHQVGQARYTIKVAPTSKMTKIGEIQIIAKSPYMKGVENKEFSKEQLREMFKFARMDQRVKEANKQLELDDEAARRYAEMQLEESKAKKIKMVLNKQKALKKCQEHHGGPITDVKRLHELLGSERFDSSTCPKEAFKLLKYEIFYQRDVVYNHHIVADKSVFVASKLVDSKMVPKPMDELIKNLESLLEPDLLASKIPDVPEESVVSSKLDELREQLCSTNQVKEVTSTNKVNYVEGDFVATYWQEADESNTWYLGRIANVIQPSACQVCADRGLDGLNKSHSEPCFEIVYLTKRNSSSKQDYVFKDVGEYHTVSCQIICKVDVSPRTQRILELKSPSSDALDRLMVSNELYKLLN